MSRTFTRFDEIEKHLMSTAPPTVYKYRSWEDEYHKDLLNKKEVWFSHPFDLNDPLDVRPQAVFNFLELQDSRLFDKLILTAQKMNPHLTSEKDLREAAERQRLYLNLNPETILQNWNGYNLVRENFDQYGVFSTSMCPLSERLWKKYGDNHTGFCLGFDTVELCRRIRSGYDYVEYSDAPYRYSFLEDTEDRDLKRLYLKKTSWGYEQEYRFITVGIGIYCNRAQNFENVAVKELILGCDSSKHEDEIVREFHSQFPGKLVHKAVRDEEGKLSKLTI